MGLSLKNVNFENIKKVCLKYEDGTELTKKIIVCNTFFTRFKGMLGQRKPDDEKVFLITECDSIHTFFMAYGIDVVFIDEFGKVLRQGHVPPFRVFSSKGAYAVLEGTNLFKSSNNIVFADFLC